MSSTILRNLLVALLCSPCLLAAAPQQKESDTVEGPNVRVLHHDDGSTTRFERSADNTTLETRMLTPDGALKLLTVYRMDKNTNPISCKIFDGSKTELYRVRYGYRKSDGQLVAEEMYDSRVVRKDPQTGKEMPVRSIQYFYDENGKRSAPIAVTTVAGKSAEEIYAGKVAIKPFVPDDNPFKKEQQQAPKTNLRR